MKKVNTIAPAIDYDLRLSLPLSVRSGRSQFSFIFSPVFSLVAFRIAKKEAKIARAEEHFTSFNVAGNFLGELTYRGLLSTTPSTG